MLLQLRRKKEAAVSVSHYCSGSAALCRQMLCQSKKRWSPDASPEKQYLFRTEAADHVLGCFKVAISQHSEKFRLVTGLPAAELFCSVDCDSVYQTDCIRC